MTVRTEGVPLETLLATVEKGASLIDQAAQAHAEAIVEAAKHYGYIRRIQRTIERVGDGIREITDAGIQMTWLEGKTIPLDLPGGLIFRIASRASLAAGRWRYPGRVKVMEQAAADPAVQAVVAHWRERILHGDQP